MTERPVSARFDETGARMALRGVPAALHVFDRYKRRMLREFGIPPEKQVLELAGMIRRQKSYIRKSRSRRHSRAGRPRIAVLPFLYNADSHRERIDGVEEDIISTLATDTTLEVDSRTT